MSEIMRRLIKLLLVIVLLIAFADTTCAKIYLVSAGITDYPGTENDLLHPAKDAQTIAWVYGKNSDVQHILLINNEATADNILNAMTQLFARASAEDIIVFFFSGHGYKGGFLAYDGALTYEKMRAAMAQSKAKNKMIFSDACFSGRMRTPGRDSGENSSIKNANVMLFLSSRSNEKSNEVAGMTNGYFTTYLQRGLMGGADVNRDRTITAKELYDYVKQGVVKISGNKQHPVMWGKFSDNMPVMKW